MSSDLPRREACRAKFECLAAPARRSKAVEFAQRTWVDEFRLCRMGSWRQTFTETPGTSSPAPRCPISEQRPPKAAVRIVSAQPPRSSPPASPGLAGKRPVATTSSRPAFQRWQGLEGPRWNPPGFDRWKEACGMEPGDRILAPRHIAPAALFRRVPTARRRSRSMTVGRIGAGSLPRLSFPALFRARRASAPVQNRPSPVSRAPSSEADTDACRSRGYR